MSTTNPSQEFSMVPRSSTVVGFSWLALLSLLTITIFAVLERGYIGIFMFQLSTFAGMQVLLDLVIACIHMVTWVRRDAKKRHRTFWPWLIITLVAGSFGLLLYICLEPLLKKKNKTNNYKK